MVRWTDYVLMILGSRLLQDEVFGWVITMGWGIHIDTSVLNSLLFSLFGYSYNIHIHIEVSYLHQCLASKDIVMLGVTVRMCVCVCVCRAAYNTCWLTSVLAAKVMRCIQCCEVGYCIDIAVLIHVLQNHTHRYIHMHTHRDFMAVFLWHFWLG